MASARALKAFANYFESLIKESIAFPTFQTSESAVVHSLQGTSKFFAIFPSSFGSMLFQNHMVGIEQAFANVGL